MEGLSRGGKHLGNSCLWRCCGARKQPFPRHSCWVGREQSLPAQLCFILGPEPSPEETKGKEGWRRLGILPPSLLSVRSKTGGWGRSEKAARASRMFESMIAVLLEGPEGHVPEMEKKFTG